MEEKYTNNKQINKNLKEVNRKYLQFDHAKSVKLKILNEVAKSLCQIKIKNRPKGTGFFLKINSKNTPYMLVTAHHVIRYWLADRNNTEIEIVTDVGNIKQNIKLDAKERKMIFLDNRNESERKNFYDITAIEIIKEDNLKDKVKFLEYDVNCGKINYSEYIDKDTFILHHPNGVEELAFSSGKITKINPGLQFEHSLDTEKGSSGSPILLIENENNNPKVIGIHTSAAFSNNYINNGYFISALIGELI